ncbi:MAG: bifunctional nuclease family protein [Planctomycetota bacterium]|nr:MAG: bifunctional nuclease family protein [Planctomycetota bacterium]
MALIPVRVSNLIIDAANDHQALVLREIDGERHLDIAIGLFEALAIQRSLHQEDFPRPLTHDLCAMLITACEAQLQGLRITGCEEGTYLAHLHLACAHKDIEMDCRPSDGVALALRSPGCGILINEELLNQPASSSDDATENDQASEDDAYNEEDDESDDWDED